MTRVALETWLTNNGANVADRLRELINRERQEIASLDRQIASLGPGTNWLQEVERLAAEDITLTEEIHRFELQVDQASQRLIQETEVLITRAESVDAMEVLAETQELFDLLSPQDLRQPVESASVAMLNSDLERSTLASKLQENVTREFIACAKVLMESECSRSRLEETEVTHDVLRGAIQIALRRLAEHGVADEVIENLTRIEDRAWFIEDVIEPYVAGAIAESEWNLATDVLGELRNGA